MAVTNLAVDGAPKKTFRPDIQGLRAVAVIAVILDHLVGWPSGGFVGVDVFFVVSGFLITGLLLREHDKTGRISFSGFYMRRVRRIVPAAALVLLVTVVAGFAVFGRLRAVQTSVDAIWALLFSANWHFAAIGTNYFAANGPVSPLQHFWSLAVEEQFYLAWPWLMLLVLSVVAKRLTWSGRTAKRSIGIVMAVIVMGSFIWAVWDSSNDPAVAYFSTFSRAWELGVGALLAVNSGRLARIPASLRPWISGVGLAAVVASLFLVTDSVQFPAPGALMPVLATAMVIAGADQKFMWPLTNRVSRYVGDISYSLYIWHFPVIVILAAIVPRGPLYYVLAILLIAMLAFFSYELVEEPVRSSLWLDPKYSHRERVRRSRQTQVGAALTARWKIVFVAFSVVLLGSAFTIVWIPSATALPPSKPAAVVQSPGQAVDLHTQSIIDALSAESWPELSPSVDELSSSRAPEWIKDGCLGDDAARESNPVANTKHCVFGPSSAAGTVVLYGDSIAISYAPGIEKALAPLGLDLQIATLASCPAMDVTVTKSDGSPFPECDTFHKSMTKTIRDMKPTLVILASAQDTQQRLVSKASSDAAIEEMKHGTESLLDGLTGLTTIVLSPPPAGDNLSVCRTTVGSPAECEAPLSQQFSALASMYSSVAAERSRTVQFVNTSTWFCFDRRCPSFIGQTPIFADGNHLTAALSESLEPQLSGVISTALSKK